MRTIDLFGVPSSMGAFVPGQEGGPAALRAAGLVERLREAGLEVRDHGDAPVRRWFPDRDHPRAQHAEVVAEVALETAARVADAEGTALVLGGDCTIGLGTLAGLQARGGRTGLLYFDYHPDMNVPESVDEGALDWMGPGHALGLDGADPRLAKAFGRIPLLRPDELWLFAHGPATAWEREQIAALGVRGTPVAEVAADPEGAARSALGSFARDVDPIALHLDVDVIDFTDLPISENPGRNAGLSFETTVRALTALLLHPAVEALTITELSPGHDPDGTQVPRFVEGVVEAFASG
jgi:arginase